MLNGFKEFISGRVPYADGLRELKRLAAGHYLLALPVTASRAADFLAGREGFDHVSKDMLVTPESVGGDSEVVIALIPKRWGGQKDLSKFIVLGEGYKLPSNYIWGYYSRWDDRVGEAGSPGFYKNPGYHGHDGLYDKWREGRPVVERPAGPTPRVGGPYRIPTGRF